MISYRTNAPAEALDLDRCLFSGQVFRWRRSGEGVYEGVDGATWYRVLRSGEVLQVESNAGPDALTGLLRLHLDVSAIAHRLVEAAPEMASVTGSLRGLRMLRPSDPVEVFFGFLCSANNHLRRIMPMVEKLAEFGDLLPGSMYRRFPTPDVIAAIPESELRAKGFGYRGASIPKAAAELVRRGGAEWLLHLKGSGYESAHRELVSIPSIGHKLADCICLYGLHYDEAVPIDTHLWQAACRVFFPDLAGKALTDRRYRQVGDFMRGRFGPLSGWAHLFLYYGNMEGKRALPAERA